MQYAAQVMRLTELQKMGYSREYLLNVFRTTQGIAWKMNPTKPNSPICFDTERLEKYRESQTRIKR